MDSIQLYQPVVVDIGWEINVALNCNRQNSYLVEIKYCNYPTSNNTYRSSIYYYIYVSSPSLHGSLVHFSSLLCPVPLLKLSSSFATHHTPVMQRNEIAGGIDPDHPHQNKLWLREVLPASKYWILFIEKQWGHTGNFLSQCTEYNKRLGWGG